mgnify:CR=1 FL=1
MYEDFLDFHGYNPPEGLDAEMAAAFEDGQKALAESRYGNGGAFCIGCYEDALASKIIGSQQPGTFLTEAERLCDFQCDICKVPHNERCVQS